MRTLGWPTPIRDRPWPEIAAFLHGALDSSSSYEPVLDIVDSIITLEVEAHLAGCTSMHDLIVAARPISPAPLDVVILRQAYGVVTIEHVTHTGRNDRISRPAQDGVALFWRFMIEKFGVHPTRTGAPSDHRGQPANLGRFLPPAR